MFVQTNLFAKTWLCLPYLCFGLGLNFVATAEPTTTKVNTQVPWQSYVESNWLSEESVSISLAQSPALTPSDDAAGGCDGVVNGTWGFHTGFAANPWWQVDLGRTIALDRVMIWNRPQAPERSAHLQVLLSEDGTHWQKAYQHNGTIFLGFGDRKPLTIPLRNQSARLVRIQLPGENYLHLEEVEVYGPADPKKNLALNRPASQISLSQWSRDHRAPTEPDWNQSARKVLTYCQRRAGELRDAGVDTSKEIQEIKALAARLAPSPSTSNHPARYLEARRIQRRLALANPLLDFETLLFTKRIPPSFNHMSDQYYGWWSKPGGGIYLLRNFKGQDAPVETCITTSFQAAGSFLRPTLSYDAQKVLFAWCKYYPSLAAEPNKLNKANVPEDAFYHLFEMNLDGSNVRRLTHGKYDNFDGRYLPDGRIVFLSTRRGQSIQAGRDSAIQTQAQSDLPDIYVRCGGGPERPVAVYTLHTMDASGGNLCAISPFEMFEWTPEIAQDGSIIYSRWDYIDRDNMPYMGLWATGPDGANPRLVYKNYTKAPHCVFEAKPVPNSHKLVFTASAHHSQTMGSLVLLDPSAGNEGASPITRLTPEIPFPEIEEWPKTYYTSPWPLSERFHLVAWGSEGATVAGPAGWDRWHAVQRPANGMSLYLLDAGGNRELLTADLQFSCTDPMPVRSRPLPPAMASPVHWDQNKEGRFLLSDVYQGLKTVRRGDIKALRLIAIPPKTHPTMNAPNLGLTADDPGKCVLGTVPVEADGSAYFRAPAGVILFFQALDARGIALQTMRSVAHVQPGQTVGCVGCHENRAYAPPQKPLLAMARAPSRIEIGPSGSWPFRFDQLVQPVLDKSCVSCHNPGSADKLAAKFDLRPVKAYETLVRFGKTSLSSQVLAGYRRGYSIERDGIADRSELLAVLTNPQGHHGLQLGPDAIERMIVWMDAYAQRLGSFSADQEQRMIQLRLANRDLFLDRTLETKNPSRHIPLAANGIPGLP